MDKLDYLSPKTTFYRNSKSSHSSSFGGCLTFCNGIIGIVLFFFFGLDLFFRGSPEVSTSAAINDSPKLDQTQFSPAFAMMYIGGFPIAEVDRKLNFTLSIGETDASTEDITKFTILSLTPCHKTALFKENRYQIKKSLIAPAESYFCIPDDVNYSIEGVFGASKFKLINVEIGYCTSSPDCYSEEFIRKNLTDIYFHSVFNDYYVDAFDFTTPVKESVSKILNSVSSGFSQTFHLNLRELEFHNQEGWIFSQNSLTKQHLFNSNDFSVSDLNNEKAIVNTVFAFDNFKQIYRRSYMKVQDVLAQVAGAIKLTNISFRLIIAVYSYFKVNFERMSSFSSRLENTQVNCSTQNNFMPQKTQMRGNKIKTVFSFFKVLRMRGKIAEFSTFYKKVLSEEILFELCVLHQMKKKNSAKKDRMDRKIRNFVEARGIVPQTNNPAK